MPTTYTFTEHMTTCRACGRRFHVTREFLDAERANNDTGDITDADLAANCEMCLHCVDGIDVPGEHDFCAQCGCNVTAGEPHGPHSILDIQADTLTWTDLALIGDALDSYTPGAAESVRNLEPLVEKVQRMRALLPEPPNAEEEEKEGDETITDEQYIAAAKLHQRDGEIEVDGNPVVSRGDDDGAYVSAWVWVPNDEIAVGIVEHPMCSICRSRHKSDDRHACE